MYSLLPHPHPSTLLNYHLEQINMVTYIFFFFLLCLINIEKILVVFGEILFCKILVNLKTSLRIKRFAKILLVVNKVILNF